MPPRRSGLAFTPSLRSPDADALPVEPPSTPAEPELFPLPDDEPPLEADFGGKSLDSDLRAAAEGLRAPVVDLSLGLERGGCDCGLTPLGDSVSPRELGVAGAFEPVAGVLPQREGNSPGAMRNTTMGDGRWKVKENESRNTP